MGLGILISLVCLWLAFRNVPFTELGETLKQANYFWLLPFVALIIILALVEAEVWRVLLEKRVSLADTFWAYNTGLLFNNIFPIRLGEPARITVLATSRNLPIMEVAVAAGLKRLLDTIMVVLLLILGLPFMTLPLEVKQGAVLFGSLAIISLVIVFGLAKSGEQGTKWVRRLLTPLSPRHADLVVARWVELVRGVTVLTRGAVGLPAVGWVILSWLIRIGLQWCVLRTFQPLAGPLEATFMVATISLAIAIPAAPGFIGVYQWAGQQALILPFPQLYTASSALSIAIISHLGGYLLGNILGVIGLWYFGQSFSGLGQKLKKQTGPKEVIPEF